jgi:hypothetical protein
MSSLLLLSVIIVTALAFPIWLGIRDPRMVPTGVSGTFPWECHPVPNPKSWAVVKAWWLPRPQRSGKWEVRG